MVIRSTKVCTIQSFHSIRSINMDLNRNIKSKHAVPTKTNTIINSSNHHHVIHKVNTCSQTEEIRICTPITHLNHPFIKIIGLTGRK